MFARRWRITRFRVTFHSQEKDDAMFRLILVCFVSAAFSLSGCGKKEPKVIESNRDIKNLKKLPKK
jgi:hypothetical protein